MECRSYRQSAFRYHIHGLTDNVNSIRLEFLPVLIEYRGRRYGIATHRSIGNNSRGRKSRAHRRSTAGARERTRKRKGGGRKRECTCDRLGDRGFGGEGWKEAEFGGRVERGEEQERIYVRGNGVGKKSGDSAVLEYAGEKRKRE